MNGGGSSELQSRQSLILHKALCARPVSAFAGFRMKVLFSSGGFVISAVISVPTND